MRDPQEGMELPLRDLGEGLGPPLGDLQEGFRVMAIMRGLPGSGKSTIASRIQEQLPQVQVCSADHHFIDEEGEYRFDLSKLGAAHAACQAAAEREKTNSGRTISY